MKQGVIVVLVAVALYLVFASSAPSAPLSFASQSGSGNVQSMTAGKVSEGSAGFLSLIDDSNCESSFEDGDCYFKSELNTYGNAQSQAFAKISAKHSIETATPSYTDYNGKTVYVGDLSIQYQCSGDKAYIRDGNLNWYTCDETGCTGNTVSKTGTYTFQAPQTSLKQVRFQCWDYDKRTATNGDWSSSWVWAGLVYDKNDNVRLVTAPEDLDGDGVTEDKDKCTKTPAGASVDAQGCPVTSTNPVPAPNEPTTGTPPQNDLPTSTSTPTQQETVYGGISAIALLFAFVAVMYVYLMGGRRRR